MRFFIATLLGCALIGCGGSTTDTDGSANTTVDCDAVARAQTCSTALFDEIRTCMGGQLDMQPLVSGKFSSDGTSCADEQEATRVVVFDPPAPSTDKSAWINSLVKLEVKRSTTTCGSVVFSSSPWSRAVTSKSGTFSISVEGQTVQNKTFTWTCPNGEQGQQPAFDFAGGGARCSAKLPGSEVIGGGPIDAEYSWGPFIWFDCSS